MRQIDKDIHMTLALAREVNRRGLADLSIDFGRAGSIAVTITRWCDNTITHSWYAYEHSLSEDLHKIRRDLTQILADGKLQKEAA